MGDDFECAIRCGSDEVRTGTVVFGGRDRRRGKRKIGPRKKRKKYG